MIESERLEYHREAASLRELAAFAPGRDDRLLFKTIADDLDQLQSGPAQPWMPRHEAAGGRWAGKLLLVLAVVALTVFFRS